MAIFLFMLKLPRGCISSFWFHVDDGSSCEEQYVEVRHFRFTEEIHSWDCGQRIHHRSAISACCKVYTDGRKDERKVSLCWFWLYVKFFFGYDFAAGNDILAIMALVPVLYYSNFRTGREKSNPLEKKQLLASHFLPLSLEIPLIKLLVNIFFSLIFYSNKCPYFFQIIQARKNAYLF